MPELPEVETVCKGLSNKILKLKVKKIKIINKQLRYVIPFHIESDFNKACVKFIVRRGKNGFIIFNNNKIIAFHLGMTGKFKFEKKNIEKKSMIIW